MNKNINNILSEVNRMNDLMMFSENREVLNESMASVLKSLRTLVRNGIGDITKYGIKEVDNLAKAMINAKTADEFFDLLNDIKVHDVKIAKQLRRDIFDILPEATQNRLRRIVTQIEDSIDSIPEDKLDDLLDDVINQQFPNEPESVRNYMKDTLSDNSDTISNKISGAKMVSSIDDLINKISKEGDSVDGVIDNLDIPQNDRAKLKRYWSSFWAKKETLYDHLRRTSKISGEEAAQLAAMTDSEIDKLIRTAADPTAAVTDKDALKALRLAMSQNPWRALPKWVRKSIIVTILSGGAAISIVKFMANAGFGLIAIGEKELDELEDKLDISIGGGVNRLKPGNEDKTLPAIQKLQPDLFDDTGGLKSEYSLSYPTDGQKVDVIDNNTFDVVYTFTLNEINAQL